MGFLLWLVSRLLTIPIAVQALSNTKDPSPRPQSFVIIDAACSGWKY